MNKAITSNMSRHVLNKNIRLLADAVILQALADLTTPDPVRAIDAALFLTGEDFGIWAEVAGIPFANGAKLLTVGNASKAAMQAFRARGLERIALPALVESEQV